MLSRRHLLKLAGLSLLSACTSRITSTPTPTRQPTASPSFTPTLQPTHTPTQTLTLTQTPSPSALIKQIIIFVQENHSFDSMFANFPGANGEAHGSICPDRVADPNHSHFAALQPNGLLDAVGDCHYTEEQIPNYWKVARAFTLCDDFYTDVRGPSAPNYFMLTSAQSPIIDSPASEDCPPVCSDAIAMPDRLIEKGLTWADYGGIFKRYAHLTDRPEIITPITQQSRIIDDALAGTLPNISWMISYFDYSGHPPASLCIAENWMVRVLNAITHGPQWESTAVFLTWDDWGGFYDHVEPPVLETWSDGTPFRLGQRVPCTVVSPYAKAGYVSHQQGSHVSLLKFIETIFDLEPLNERDAQASDMLDCFDFNQSPHPPIDLVERDCA